MFRKKFISGIADFKEMPTFATAIERDSDKESNEIMVRQFSWLEYMPVTHGVTGSSPVRTASQESKNSKSLDSQQNQGFFIACNKAEYSVSAKYSRG